MERPVDALCSRAFGRVSASEANAQIERLRASTEGRGRSYEVVVEPSEDLRRLAERLLPRFVYYLESVGASLPECAGVFLSVFVGDDLYFVHARDAVALLAEAMEVSLADLAKRRSLDGQQPLLLPR